MSIKEADAIIEKALKEADQYGSEGKRSQEVNRNGINDKIREAQAKARKAIIWKAEDNKRRGRTYGDGL